MFDYGYLQHGTGTAGPFRTERVHVKPRGWPHAGEWLALYSDRWRVVRVRSVKGSPFIVVQGKKINIQIEGV